MIYSNNTKIPSNEMVGAFGFYAHGKLEEYLEYDIVLVPFSTNPFIIDLPEGIYPTVVKHNEEEISCIMYCWKRPISKRLCGILVFPDDVEANEYAKSNYGISEHL